MNNTTQAKGILSHLKGGYGVNPLMALELWGCFRLGARIHDLRNQGHDIVTERVTRNGKTFANYKLIK